MKLRFFIRPDGTVNAVSSDTFFKIFPTGNSVQRLSNVEFNSSLQRWEARWPQSNRVLTSGLTHGDCVRRERKIVERSMAERHGALA